MTLECRIDKLDLEVRDARISVSLDRAADLFRRTDEAHLGQLVYGHESFKGAAPNSQGAETIFPRLLRVLINTSINLYAEMNGIRVSAGLRGHLFELSKSFCNIFRQ